jgi:hypothetical protein
MIRRTGAMFLGLLVLIAVSPAHAIDMGPEEQYAGVVFGAVLPASVEVEEEEFDTKAAWSFGVFYDFPFASRFYYGFGLDFHRQRWSVPRTPETSDIDKTLLNLSARFGYYIGSDGSTFGLRPVLALGFATLESQQNVSASNYFTVRAGGELLYSGSEAIGLVAEAFVWYTPAGEDDDETIRIGPSVFMRAGIVF